MELDETWLNNYSQFHLIKESLKEIITDFFLHFYYLFKECVFFKLHVVDLKIIQYQHILMYSESGTFEWTERGIRGLD